MEDDHLKDLAQANDLSLYSPKPAYDHIENYR